MLVPKNIQYCTLNCERRQISKCLDVMEKNTSPIFKQFANKTPLY